MAEKFSLMGSWKRAKGEPAGMFTAGKTAKGYTTPDFSKFAESSRSRWDLFAYLKVIFQQLLRKK